MSALATDSVAVLGVSNSISSASLTCFNCVCKRGWAVLCLCIRDFKGRDKAANGE